MSTLLEVQKQLQHALSESAKAQAELDSAIAKLQPLKESAEEKQKEVNNLIRQFQQLTGVVAPAVKGRRGSTGPRKVYNISPESKIGAAGKRAHTRALNSGLTEAEAKKAQRDAEKSLSAKLGVK
jgi:hypothetical protein